MMPCVQVTILLYLAVGNSPVILNDAPFRCKFSGEISSAIWGFSFGDTMQEKWMPVLGFEGLYAASDLGKIKSLERVVHISVGWCGSRDRVIKERILKGGKTGITPEDGQRYLAAGFCKDGVVKILYVHRTIWEAFNGLIPDGYEINHLDGVKANNNLVNLELVTRRGNFDHAMKMGLNKICYKGVDNPTSVLDDDKVREIRRRIASGERQCDIADDFGVCRQTITNVKQGKCWGHVE